MSFGRSGLSVRTEDRMLTRGSETASRISIQLQSRDRKGAVPESLFNNLLV